MVKGTANVFFFFVFETGIFGYNVLDSDVTILSKLQ